MKKVVLVFLLFRIIFNVNTYGQNAVQKFLHGEFYDGFIVLLNGDTIKGKIPFRDTDENYYQVKIKNTSDNELTTYFPNEVLVYSVDSLLVVQQARSLAAGIFSRRHHFSAALSR